MASHSAPAVPSVILSRLQPVILSAAKNPSSLRQWPPFPPRRALCHSESVTACHSERSEESLFTPRMASHSAPTGPSSIRGRLQPVILSAAKNPSSLRQWPPIPPRRDLCHSEPATASHSERSVEILLTPP